MKLAFPVLALFLFAACNAGASNKVAGTYVIDAKALVAAMPAEMKEPLTKAGKDVEKEMAPMFEGTSIELNADGTATMKTKDFMTKKEKVAKGTWKLDGDKITMTSKDADSGKDETKTGTFKDGTITVDIPEPNSQVKHMVFRKK